MSEPNGRQCERRPLRVAGYARVSSARQANEGDSLEAQQNRVHDHMSRRLGKDQFILTMYVDAGRSAKNQNRPELQRLKRDVEAGRLDRVIVWKLDRITRSLLDFTDLWEFFRKHNVELISIQEDFDTSTPMGEAMLMIIMVFAQLERKLIGERTLAVMQDRAARGLWNGGFIIGYRSDPNEKGRLVTDPEWASIVRQHFFHAFEELGSVGAVTRKLLTIGVRVPSRKSKDGKTRGGKAFTKQQVMRVLTNRLYLGEIRWGGAVSEKAHEAVVSLEQFERVQRLIRENLSTRRNHKVVPEHGYLLRGLVRCGECGHVMTPYASTGRNGLHHYYSCTNRAHRGKGACGSPYIPAVALEQAVVTRLVHLSGDDAARDRIISEAIGRSYDQKLWTVTAQ